MTWEIGDLAVCIGVDELPWTMLDGSFVDGPSINEVVKVVRVFTCPIDNCLALDFLEYHNPEGWAASEFRKIKPDTDATEIEEGLIAKIKGKQPVTT